MAGTGRMRSLALPASDVEGHTALRHVITRYLVTAFEDDTEVHTMPDNGQSGEDCSSFFCHDWQVQAARLHFVPGDYPFAAMRDVG